MEMLLVILLVFGVCVIVKAQNYIRKGNTFEQVSNKKSSSKTEPTKTKFTWKDSNGVEYPIYIGATGSCFIIKTSQKSGKEYRYYLGEDASKAICSELGVEYKPKKSK